MSELLTNAYRLFHDRKFNSLPEPEQKAHLITIDEAEKADATLHNPMATGIPPSLALGVYRRDLWRCPRCQGAEGLQIHHKGGLKYTHWRDVGKKNKRGNLVTICKSCHDSIHDEDRAGGNPNFKQHRYEGPVSD